jgi:hypothetical protein
MVQTSELTSIRTRLLCEPRCSALQATFPGSKNGHASAWLIEIDLLMADYFRERHGRYRPALALKQYLKYIFNAQACRGENACD